MTTVKQVKDDGSSKEVSAKAVMAKETFLLPVPVRDLTPLEAIVTGFRMCVIETKRGNVSTHGGMGSAFAVTMEWDGRYCTIHSVDLLAAWVETFDPKAAADIRDAWPKP